MLLKDDELRFFFFSSRVEEIKNLYIDPNPVGSKVIIVLRVNE